MAARFVRTVMTSPTLHRSRHVLNDTTGWYGQPLRATTILSVRKDDKVVRAITPTGSGMHMPDATLPPWRARSSSSATARSLLALIL